MRRIALGLIAACLYAQKPRVTPDEPLLIVKDNKYGFIDHQGGMVIQPQFYWADGFEQGLASAFVCGRMVSIDHQGNPQPLRIALPGELVPKRKNGKVGFVDASGQFKIAPIYDDALPFHDGMAAVAIGGKWGFVDTAGRTAVAPQFENTYYFFEGLGLVQTGSSREGLILIDKTGRKVAGGFDFVNGVAEGRAAVARNGKSGFIDLTGKLVIPLVYDWASAYSEGLAQVTSGAKFGYIDKTGRVAIRLQFDWAGSFINGLAPVALGDQVGLISRKGRFVVRLPALHITELLWGDVASFWTKDSFGYVNSSGKVIWGPTNESNGSPDHPPLFGWTDEDKVKSCAGLSEALRQAVAALP